jgi:hypothetical protein
MASSPVAARNSHVLRAALEEARSGWVMVEKFDDQQLRLKRRADARTSEYGSDIDPYRTYYGRTPTQQGMQVLAWVLAARDYGVFTATLASSGSAPLLHALAGMDQWFTPRLGMSAEVRYSYARANPSQAFRDFYTVDLGGVQATLGFSVRW